jgi:hypothetical protein
MTQSNFRGDKGSAEASEKELTLTENNMGGKVAQVVERGQETGC